MPRSGIPCAKKPHVCFVAPNAYPVLAGDESLGFAGGAELQQVLIAKALLRHGYRVSMICLDFGQQELCQIDGITVFRAFRPGAGIPILRFVSPRMTSIWRCLRKADADVYYHRAGSMLTGLMVAFCRRYRKKAVFSVAGKAEVRFARDKLLYEYGVRRADRIVVQNEAQKREIQNKFGRDSILIPSIYEPDLSKSVLRPECVLWVSMVREVKRPDIFLAIASALPQYRFVMVGGAGIGDAALYESIRARAAQLDNVQFVGFIPYEKVGLYFDQAALFVNTSESEGFPNTFLQAWSRGVPTLSFVDSGSRLDGEPIGVQVESTAEMVGKVREIMDDPDLRSAIGRRAKTYLESKHSQERILELYDGVLAGLVQGIAPSDPG